MKNYHASVRTPRLSFCSLLAGLLLAASGAFAANPHHALLVTGTGYDTTGGVLHKTVLSNTWLIKQAYSVSGSAVGNYAVVLNDATGEVDVILKSNPSISTAVMTVTATNGSAGNSANTKLYGSSSIWFPSSIFVGAAAINETLGQSVGSVSSANITLTTGAEFSGINYVYDAHLTTTGKVFNY